MANLFVYLSESEVSSLEKERISNNYKNLTSTLYFKIQKRLPKVKCETHIPFVKRVGIHIPEEMLTKIKCQASQLGISPSNYVRFFILQDIAFPSKEAEK